MDRRLKDSKGNEKGDKPMKKYIVVAGMTLLLTLAASQMAWAGGYVVVGPRAPAVVYVPNPFYAPVVIVEPPLLGGYGYGYGYSRYHYGYGPHGHHNYYNHGYRAPVMPRGRGYAPSRGGWGRR
jgi:hypothetical protein